MLRKKELVIVAAILFLAAAWFYQDPEWNGNSRLELTRAIVEQGNFRIDNYHTAPAWLTEDTSIYAGHYYTDKAIGSSLFAVPFYFLLFHLAASLGVSLGSDLIKHILTTIVLGGAFTLNGVVLFLIADQITQKSWKALIASLALSFGTMLWPYSAVFYGHVITGAFLILAFYLLFSRRNVSETISSRRLFFTGMVIGLAFITEYTSSLIILGLCLYTAYNLRGQKPKTFVRLVAIGFVGSLVPLSLMFVYNLMVYATTLAFGYTHEASDTFQQGMSQGLFGIHFPDPSVLYHITLDPQFGLLWLSPLLLLTPIGYFILFRKSAFRAEGLLSLYSVAALLALNAGYYLWWGGNAFGPRILIPALPFFIIPLAILPDSLLPILGILGILSGFQMLIPLIGQIQIDIAYIARLNAFRIAHVPFHDFSILYSYVLPQILTRYQQGIASWNLGSALGLPYWISVLPLLLVEAGLILLFRRIEKPLSTYERESG